MKLVKAAQIGGRAKQILKLYKHYAVIGVTSRGIFFATPEKWVLFLSREQYRGPLTINLDAGSFQDGAVKKGENITLWENQLRFHKSDLRINLDGAQTWQPSLPEIDFGHKQQANLLHEIKLLGDAFLQSVLTGNHAPGADMTLSLIHI